MNMLGEAIFKRILSIDRATFDVVLNEMGSYFIINATKAGNSSGEPISLMTRLAASLRWLAGGSYLDLCFTWGVGTSTFYADNGVLWPTLIALDGMFPMGFPVDNAAKLEELSIGFYKHSSGLLDGCVLALD